MIFVVRKLLPPNLCSLTVSNEEKSIRLILCDFKIKDKLLWVEILRRKLWV